MRTHNIFSFTLLAAMTAFFTISCKNYGPKTLATFARGQKETHENNNNTILPNKKKQIIHANISGISTKRTKKLETVSEEIPEEMSEEMSKEIPEKVFIENENNSLNISSPMQQHNFSAENEEEMGNGDILAENEEDFDDEFSKDEMEDHEITPLVKPNEPKNLKNFK